MDEGRAALGALLNAEAKGFLTTRPLIFLLMIESDPGHSLRDYAAMSGLSRPALFRAGQVLCELGLVTQTRPSRDFRLNNFGLTKKGTTMLTEIFG